MGTKPNYEKQVERLKEKLARRDASIEELTTTVTKLEEELKTRPGGLDSGDLYQVNEQAYVRASSISHAEERFKENSKAIDVVSVVLIARSGGESYLS